MYIISFLLTGLVLGLVALGMKSSFGVFAAVFYPALLLLWVIFGIIFGTIGATMNLDRRLGDVEKIMEDKD